MKYIFGPVPSRRLGRSLGIDPVPFKTCNWNCVYCQLGYTAPLATQRAEYCPTDELLAEVRRALVEHEGQIDWITFAGSGEPTLHLGLGKMLRSIKARTDLPVAVMTNGSLLRRVDVREELMAADAVMPTLDAGSEALYLRIVRPHREFSFESLVEGLTAFSAGYRGRLAIEVMLVRGINDTEEALQDLASVLRRIGPDEVQINLPVRPPAVSWVEPSDRAGVIRAAAILGELAEVVVPPSGGLLDLSGAADVIEGLVEVLQRHPLSEKQIVDSLGPEVLDRLAADGRLQPVVRGDARYWCYRDGAYSGGPR